MELLLLVLLLLQGMSELSEPTNFISYHILIVV